MSGSVHGRTGNAGELRFLRNLTTSVATQIFEALETGRKAGTLQPHFRFREAAPPSRMPIISRLFGVKDSHKLDVYVAHDGYKGMERALKE